MGVVIGEGRGGEFVHKSIDAHLPSLCQGAEPFVLVFWKSDGQDGLLRQPVGLL